MLGLGCNPVLVKGNKEQFLSWLGDGLWGGDIRFPADSGSIHWPSLESEADRSACRKLNLLSFLLFQRSTLPRFFLQCLRISMPELATIYDYMRAHATLLGERILQEYPALHPVRRSSLPSN